MRYCETGHHGNDGESYDENGMEACFDCALKAGAIDEAGRYVDRDKAPAAE